MIAWLALLGLFAAPSGLGDALVHAPAVALVRVQGPSQGGLAVEVTTVVAGHPPPACTLTGAPGSAPAGTELLAPIAPQADGTCVYAGDLHRLATVAPGERRAVVAFAARWRQEAGRPAAAAAPDWIALLGDPTAVAREAAEEALLRHAPDLAGRLGDTSIAALVDLIGRPQVPTESRLAALRVLDVLGGRRGADALAERFTFLPSIAPVRHLAVETLARHATPETTAALQRCMAEAGPDVAAHCRRVLGVHEAPRDALTRQRP